MHVKLSQPYMYVVPIWGRARGQFASFPPPHCNSPAITLTFTVLVLQMSYPVSVMFPWRGAMAL